MFISIKQVKANFKNEFRIDVKGKDGDVTYMADTPWLNISLPFNLENMRELFFRDANGQVIFSTKYDYIENTIESAIPFKYLFTGNQKFCQMSIIDASNIEHGKFYTKMNGFMDSKFAILYENKEVLGYEYSRGSIKHISFYNGDIQVAQLIKPLNVADNLDEYYLYIADEYDYLNIILSFFTIYVDYMEYGNSGEIVIKKREYKREYTFSKNDKYYNPKWIADNFGEAEVLKFNKMIEAQKKKFKQEFSRIVKIIVIVWGSILVFTAIFLAFLFKKF